jgi:hypothetical protein
MRKFHYALCPYVCIEFSNNIAGLGKCTIFRCLGLYDESPLFEYIFEVGVGRITKCTGPINGVQNTVFLYRLS